MTTREVLVYAAESDISGLTDSEKNAVKAYRRSAEMLSALEAQREKQEKLYRESNVNTPEGRKDAVNARDKMRSLQGQIDSVKRGLHSAEGRSVLKNAEKKAREAIQEESGGFTEDSDDDIIKLSQAEEDELVIMDYEDINIYDGKLDNRTVRRWYIEHDKQIYNLIDQNLTIEQQARQACELRNLYRTQARNLMYDQKKRVEFDIRDPNKTFEELVIEKMSTYGLTFEEACRYILLSASRTRKSVNKELGLE